MNVYALCRGSSVLHLTHCTDNYRMLDHELAGQVRSEELAYEPMNHIDPIFRIFPCKLWKMCPSLVCNRGF